MFKKKKGQGQEDVTTEAPPPRKKSAFKFVLIAILISLLIAGIGAGGVYYLMTRTPPIAKSTLTPEALSFLEKQLPELYSGYALLDQEMVMTDNEMIRIAKIGETFPEQKKIADTEYKIWETSMKALQKGQADFEKDIQVFFVSYQVNPETGKTLMDEKKDALKQNLDGLLAASKPLTDKLREIEAKKPMPQRILDQLSKGKP